MLFFKKNSFFLCFFTFFQPSMKKWNVQVLVLHHVQLFSDSMDCNLPGFFVHGILQARILEWVAISFSRGSSWPKDRTQVSCIAAAAKLLQSCPTLFDPIDSSPPSSPVPGILQARTLEWVSISSSNAWEWKVKVKLLSPLGLLATPWTVAYQAPPSMGFSRQEYWSMLPFSSPLHCRQILYCLSHHQSPQSSIAS